jgi:hypothetical protein
MYYRLDIGMMDTQLPGKKAEQPGPDPKCAENRLQ